MKNEVVLPKMNGKETTGFDGRRIDETLRCLCQQKTLPVPKPWQKVKVERPMA